MPTLVRIRSRFTFKGALVNFDKIVHLEPRPDIGPGMYDAYAPRREYLGEISHDDLLAAGILIAEKAHAPATSNPD